MQINDQQTNDLFRPGGKLYGATVSSIDLYGEYACDGSYEGASIIFILPSGELASITLDTINTEGAAVHFATTADKKGV